MDAAVNRSPPLFAPTMTGGVDLPPLVKIAAGFFYTLEISNLRHKIAVGWLDKFV